MGVRSLLGCFSITIEIRSKCSPESGEQDTNNWPVTHNFPFAHFHFCSLSSEKRIDHSLQLENSTFTHTNSLSLSLPFTRPFTQARVGPHILQKPVPSGHFRYKNRYTLTLTYTHREREGGIHLSGIKLCSLTAALVLVIRRMRLVLAFVSGSLGYFLTSLFLSFFPLFTPPPTTLCHVKNTSNAQDEWEGWRESKRKVRERGSPHPDPPPQLENELNSETAFATQSLLLQ